MFESKYVVVRLFDIEKSNSSLSERFVRSLTKKLSTGNFILGRSVEIFEKKFAEFVGVKHVIGVASGTDALVIALEATTGEDTGAVLTSPFSYFASTSSIIRSNSRPTYVDIDKTLNMRNDKASLSKHGHLKAILPVHLFGNPWIPPTEGYEELPPIIHDCAQCLDRQLARHLKLRTKDAACFSFFPTKNLGALGDGGAIATNDDNIAQICRSLRSQGSEKKHLHTRVGMNSRLDALQAEFLLIKMDHLDSQVTRRRDIAKSLEEELSRHRIAVIPKNLEQHNYNLFTVHILENKRQLFQEMMSELGVETAIYYPRPIHLQPAMQSFGFHAGSFPNAESATQTCISIPCHHTMDRIDVKRVTSALARVLGELDD